MSKVTRLTSSSGQGAEVKTFEDVVFPNFDVIDPERGISYVKEFKYKNGDVVMCTYPKVGTHWMGNMLLLMKSFDMSKRSADTILEFGPPEVFETQDYPRLIPTHLKPTRVHPENIASANGKVVLLLRNPNDVAVSNYYHLKNAVAFQNKQTWDEYFESFLAGEPHHGSYFKYLSEWEQVLNERANGKSGLQVEVFYYEDMLVNLQANIERLNRFLGWDRDQSYLDQVMQAGTFQSMSAYYVSNKDKINPASVDGQGNSVILRKGHVGDWKSHLTVAQSKAVDAKLQEVLKHDIIKFKYEN